MQPEAPAQKPRRYRHLVRWIFIGILAILGWCGWKAYDFRRAIEEARGLGWKWSYNDPFARIKENWKNGFRKETWKSTSRDLGISRDNKFEGHSDLVRRLNPTQISIENTFLGRDLSELKGLSDLTKLWLYKCPNLANIDALKDMKDLSDLKISEAPVLLSIDALKDLKTLERLDLFSCYGLTDLDALRDLATLKTLIVINCTRLKNVDGILGLEGLQELDLYANGWLTKETLTVVRSALPKTKISASYSEP